MQYSRMKCVLVLNKKGLSISCKELDRVKSVNNQQIAQLMCREVTPVVSMHGGRSVLCVTPCISRQQKGESCLGCLSNQGSKRINLLESYIYEKER